MQSGELVGQTCEILTPDQRLRVFISSTLKELAPERRTVQEAVEALHLVPVMFEAGARPHPPRTLYRAYLEQSHIFVGIYWQSYGWVAPDMDVSGLEDEYRLSEGKPALIYVKKPAPEREPRMAELLQSVQRDDRVSYRYFESTEELAKLVADDLAVLLTERFQSAVGKRSSPLGTIKPRPLPIPPSPIIGREADLFVLADTLSRDEVRLITLTGPGGVGKTRLGLEAACDLSSWFADGVFFVDLAPLSDAEDVPAAVASSIGMTYERSRLLADSVVEVLTPASVLLLFDNFEHVTGAAPFLASLLAACPHVKALATSRIPLHLRGEHEYPVKPLAVPSGEPSFEQILSSPAVTLFTRRAEEAKPDFAVTRENAPAIAELCRRLDGLPLAIELTAPAVRLFPPTMLLERVGNSLDAFVGDVDLPERQRTLRATLDWSHSLLDEQERRMLARLSVFVGGFTLEAAEALCSDPDEPDVMQGLSSLVDKSLVVIEEGPAGSPRFKLLETVQAYANEKLRERGEVEDAYRRHGEFFLDFARVAGEELRTVRQRQWFLRVSADHPNIDAALRRAFERGDIATGLGLVATWIYSWTVCDSAPYWALFEALHEQHSSLPDDAQAWLLFGLGAGRLQTRPRDAEAPFTEVVELRRSRGDRMEEADAEVFLAEALPPSRKAEAIDHCEHALELYGELHDLWGCGFARIHLGAIALRDGDPARAEAMLREGLAIGRKLDCDHLTGLALCGIGLDELALGRPEAACSAFTEAAQLLLGIYSREGLAYCLDGFAAVALAKGAAEDAAFFLGAADGTRKEIGYGVWPTLRPVVDKISSDVREALGDDVFDKAREMGAAMRTREAVEKGLNLSLTCFGGTGP